ncbi:MAG: DUF1289 domain-containing protein [Rhodospirillaceae bacterium]
MATETDTARSPCVNRCRVDPASGTCSGCRRTVAEIGNWTRMSKERRLRVLARLSGSQPNRPCAADD